MSIPKEDALGNQSIKIGRLGLRVPADMDGRVVEELFDEPLLIESEHARPIAAQPEDREVYDEREQEILTRRLADLGYLE